MPVNPKTGQPTGTVPIPYNDSKIKANDAYAQAVAALRHERGDTLSEYGYMKQGGKYRVDPNATYGAYQSLGRAQGQEMTDLSNAQFGAGLTNWQGGFSGLARQQQGTARMAQGAETKDLLNEFQNKMQAIRMGFIQAGNQKGKTLQSGTLQAIINAITAGQFTPAAPVR